MRNHQLGPAPAAAAKAAVEADKKQLEAEGERKPASAVVVAARPAVKCC